MRTDIRAAIVTVSDTRLPNDDLSGKLLAELLWSIGAEIVETMIVTDDLTHLRETLYTLTEREDVNLIMTTGGTGFGPRDNTPEATRAVIEREAPGLAEATRAVNPGPGRLSRGVAGTVGQALILNTPGSPKGAQECLDAVLDILPHALRLLAGTPTEH